MTAAGVRATTGIIQQTWAELLGLSDFRSDDDFFELGGHSLMAVSAVATLSARLGVELPEYALFAAPTAAEMAELVADVVGKHAAHGRSGTTPFLPDWVVPLHGTRNGTARPVFVFPAGHNESVALGIEARVAAHVGADRPFWGFRRDSADLDGARGAGVPGMAAAYVAQMRAIQGEGPFLLYANCAGAPYAWDAARQLLHDGEDIAGMLFFEAPLSLDASSATSGVTPALISTPAPAEDDYRPPPLPVGLTLLMTKFWREHGWSDAWDQVALGSVETVVIPGETEKAFERREERIARHVRDWIAASESRARGS